MAKGCQKAFFGTEVLLAQKLVDCPRKWLIGVQYSVQDVHGKSPMQKIEKKQRSELVRVPMKLVGRLGSWNQRGWWWPPFHFYPRCKVIGSCLHPLPSNRYSGTVSSNIQSPFPRLKLPPISCALRAQSSFVSMILCAENTMEGNLSRGLPEKLPRTHCEGSKQNLAKETENEFHLLSALNLIP